MIEAATQWLEGILSIVNPMRPLSTQEIKDTIKAMMEKWIQYLEIADPNRADTLKSQSITDTLVAIACLAIGDIKGFSRFALHFGSFDPTLAANLA